jgi:hypothetical protein
VLELEKDNETVKKKIKEIEWDNAHRPQHTAFLKDYNQKINSGKSTWTDVVK